MATEMAKALETLEPIQETLSEIKKRTPELILFNFITCVLIPLGTGHASSEQLDARPRALRMDWAACVLPRHGEDAHFGHAEAGVIGVADGVGGFRRRGVDAGAFARELIANALAAVERAAKARRQHRLRPKALLDRAYETAAGKGTPGASTAVILSLHRTALRWAYIGDSAFAVLRGGKIVYRSVQQQHRFNCPYQLSSNGDLNSLARAKVGGMSTVKEGDVVVVGTDGLFDNMYDGQLVRAVAMGAELGFSPKNMADIVAGIAYSISESKSEYTPYGRGYVKTYGKMYYGGKKDDITVVVAYIVSKDSLFEDVICLKN